MKRTHLITFVTGLLLLSAALVLWSLPEPQAAAPEPRSLGVKVARVTPAGGSRTVRLPGIIRSAQRATLAFSVPARLATRPAQIGRWVEAGDTLATVDARQFGNSRSAAEAALAEIEVRLAQAERDHERVSNLAAVGAATTEELERVEAAAKALAAARDAARTQLDESDRMFRETILRAPFAGTVTAVFLEPGEWASPGRPVVEISGAGNLEMEVQLPEIFAGKLEPGQPAAVELPFAGGTRVAGRLQSVSRAAVGPGRLFPAVVNLATSAEARAGMSAEALLVLGADEALAVPLVAVLNPGSSQPKVFRLHNGRAEQVVVVLGELRGEMVLIHSGLNPDDVVVTSGHTRLADGDSVEVLT